MIDAPPAQIGLVVEANQIVPVLPGQCRRPPRHRDPGAELHRLHLGPERQVAAGDPRREAEIVLDPRRGAGLPADRQIVDGDRRQTLRCAIDRGRQPGGTGADHDQIGRRLLIDGQVETERLGQVEDARIAQGLLAADHDPDVAIATAH